MCLDVTILLTSSEERGIKWVKTEAGIGWGRIVAEHQRLRAEDQGLRAEDQRLRAEHQGLRAEDQRLRAEHQGILLRERYVCEGFTTPYLPNPLSPLSHHSASKVSNLPTRLTTGQPPRGQGSASTPG